MLHTVWARVNIIFTFSVTCMSIIAGVSALSVIMHHSNPVVSLTNVEVVRMRHVNRPYASGEQAYLSFDLSADLNSVWNWNVKQVFIYVQAEYQNSKNSVNHAVIWDSIIQEEDFLFVKLHAQKSKYPLVDLHSQFRGKPFNLSLHWDVMPWVGLLRPGGGVIHNVASANMPSAYI